MESGAVTEGPSLNELLADARELVNVRPQLVRMVEGQARVWKEQLNSRPPTNEQEREHYRGKAAEFRALICAQLDIMVKASLFVGELIPRLDELSAPEQAAVLREQLDPILANEAATAGALASALDVVVLIDELTT